MDLIGCRIACPKEPASKDDKVAVSKIPRMAYSVAWAVFRTGNSMLSAYFVRSISDMEEKSGTKTLPTVMPTRRLVLVDSVAGCAEKEKIRSIQRMERMRYAVGLYLWDFRGLVFMVCL